MRRITQAKRRSNQVRSTKRGHARKNLAKEHSTMNSFINILRKKLNMNWSKIRCYRSYTALLCSMWFSNLFIKSKNNFLWRHPSLLKDLRRVNHANTNIRYSCRYKCKYNFFKILQSPRHSAHFRIMKIHNKVQITNWKLKINK